MNRKWISSELWKRGVPHRILWSEGGPYVAFGASWGAFIPIDDAEDANFVAFVEKSYKERLEPPARRAEGKDTE